MQFYQGPSRRVLKRTSGTSEFRLDGTRDHEEERAVYIKQTISLRQKTQTDRGTLADHLAFDEEKEQAFHGGGVYAPFRGKHEIDDKLLLNKSIGSLHFIPDNCRNFLKIENQAQIRMAPLLCSKRYHENILKAPEVTHNNPAERPTSVFCQLGAYGRFWFGSTVDLYELGQVGLTNREGHNATYTLPNLGADAGAGNREVPRAWGIRASQMPVGYPLRQTDQQLDIGLEYSESMCGEVEFIYDENTGTYKSKAFEQQIPWPLDAPVAGQEKIVVIPSISTDPLTDDAPFNYFSKDVIKDQANNVIERKSRAGLWSAAEITVAGLRNEDLNGSDFRILDLGHVAGVPLSMFIPTFRIVNGNLISSISRPVRYATTEAVVVAQDWVAEPEINLAIAGLDEAANKAAQVPFWAFYEDTKHRNHGIGDRLWGHKLLGRIARPNPDPAQLAAQAALDANQTLINNAVAARDVGAQLVIDTTAAAAVGAGLLAAAQAAVAANAQAIIDAQAALDANQAVIDAQTAIVNEGIGGANGYDLADVVAAGQALAAAQAARPALQTTLDDANGATAGLNLARNNLVAAQNVLNNTRDGAIAAQIILIQAVTDANNARPALQAAVGPAGIVTHADQPCVCLRFEDAANLTAEQEAFVQRILTLACDQRMQVGGAFQAHDRTVQILMKRRTDVNQDKISGYQYFTIDIDELNAFRAPHDAGDARFGHRVIDGGNEAAKQAIFDHLKAQRMVQISPDSAHRFYHMKEHKSPFYDTYAYEIVPAGGGQAAARAAISIVPQSGSKPFHYRSVEQFLNQITAAVVGANDNFHAEEFFDVAADGLIGQYQFDNILDGGQDHYIEFFLPVREE